MRNSLIAALCIVLLAALSAPAPAAEGTEFQAEKAEQWSRLFDCTAGWTGADGAYSIPLSGRDAGPPEPGARTLFLFGDTFIGEVEPDGSRRSGTVMINNTAALLEGPRPKPENIEFYWRRKEDEDGEHAAAFLPSTPQAKPPHYYWPMDGAVLGDRLYLFASRMKPAEGKEGGAFNFALDGIALLSSDVGSITDFESYRQVDTSLRVAPEGDGGEVTFGNSVMLNTEPAGAPDPDGFVYIYGLRHDPMNKKLLAARVRPDHIDQLDRWRFWDGDRWTSSIGAAAPLTDRLSAGFSVSPLPDGRCVCVFQLDGIGRHVALRFGRSPVGPFGPAHRVWKCPETEQEDIFCYNAKAHPHLSPPGELLISYNVNSFDFWGHFRDSDIYRPRFIRVRLPERPK